MHPNFLKTLNQGLAVEGGATVPEPKCRTCKTVHAEFCQRKKDMLDSEEKGSGDTAQARGAAGASAGG